MTEFPQVSVLIVFRNEAKHLAACIRSVLRQFDSNDRWELIFVDGMSKDTSREIIESEMKASKVGWRIINNPGKTLAKGWNLGIRAARGSFIIRPDGHAELGPGYVKTAIGFLNTYPKCAAVGGRLITRASGFHGNIIRQALTSKTGVGNSSFRTGAPAGVSDTVVYGLYRKEVFELAGLFNENLIRHQDTEMHFRIRRAGFEFRYTPEIFAVYYCRDSYKALLRQMYLIGRHLPDLVKAGLPRALQPRHLAPLTFYLTLSILLFAAFWFKPAAFLSVAIMILYLSLILIESLINAVKQRDAKLILTTALIPPMHLFYAFGTLRGLLSLAK